MKKVIVIGAGAAGMMAACTAAAAGNKVVVLEKNEKAGKKIYITGKGRCNLTNGCEIEELFTNVVSNPKFLYSAFYEFDNQAVIRFFEEAGCPTKEERGARIFPVSDHAIDVINALERKMRQAGVELRLGCTVQELCVSDDQEIKGVLLTDGSKLSADAVIVATGGISYPSTGSTGDGYRFAGKCGHQITEQYPSLVPLTVKESWCRELQGLSLKNVQVTLKKEKKEIFSGFGELLFTHFGVSGPLLLSASSYYVKKYQDQQVTMKIDLKPALSMEQLDKRILRDFEEAKNKQYKNALGGLLPAKMIPVTILLSGIDPEKKVNEITRQERSQLLSALKEMPLTITGTRGYNEAIITKGGITVKEVNPSTMESRLVKNLYFAGEVLDLDALTGGFNLQIAWSTGYLAGQLITA